MEAELSPRGYYYTSYLHMYMDGDFDPCLSNMTHMDLGTFVHEYVHYLQNISTIFGLRSSEFSYSEMLQIKSEVLEAEKITLPVHVTKPAYIRMTELFTKCWGTSLSITDINQDSVVTKENHSKDGLRSHINYVIEFDSPTGDKMEVVFGIGHIKEGMAFMYQRFFDPNIAKKDDLPYNLVEILSNLFSPSIDTKKLICICYTSLFFLHAAEVFFELCKIAEDNPNISGPDLHHSYLQQQIVEDKSGKYNVQEYLAITADRFRTKLSANLISELDFIDAMLKRVINANPHSPLLTMLYAPDFPSIESLDLLVGYYGIPLIETPFGLYYPSKIINQNESETQSTEGRADASDFMEKVSDDVIELIAHRAMISYLKKPQQCGLISICNHSDWIDANCYESPWSHEPPCIFSVVSTHFKLVDKIEPPQ